VLVLPSSYSSGAVHWVEVDHDSGVVVRLGVGSGGDVGDPDAGDRGSASVLEEARVER
jgi:hypothetical protein